MLYARELQHTHGHYKFWRFFVAPADAIVHYQWGRIGTAGQSRTKTYYGRAAAIAAANAMAEDKLTNGYHEVEPPASRDEVSYEKAPTGFTYQWGQAAQPAPQATKAMNPVITPAKVERARAVANKTQRERAADAKPGRAIVLGDDDL